MHGLHTDLYQLTMAAGYFQSGKKDERATFEMFVRRLPDNRQFLITAGIAQAVEYLLDLRFSGDEIDYLRTLPQFAQAQPGFFEYLREFRFTGDLFAVREGTPILAGEPILAVRAPVIEAQIPETFVLSIVGFQTMIAAKAARVVAAAEGRAVVEFGTRRAHSPEAGLYAARSAYLAGCVGTSNVEAGFRFGVPVYGTAAHSWVQAFCSEGVAFRELQRLLGPNTVQLIDTYDTVEGARHAVETGGPFWGVRLDSGDLSVLSKQVRRILDEGGFSGAKIMASGDLNEDRIATLLQDGAPIDVFGVGTELATSSDAPNIAAVYKMVEIEIGGIKRYVRKTSPEKVTLPGTKQIFRYQNRDVVGCSWECPSCPSGSEPCEALLRPVILGGRLLEPLPSLAESREYCAASVAKFSPTHYVTYSEELKKLAERL